MDKRYLIAFLIGASCMCLYFALKRRKSPMVRLVEKLEAELKRKYGDDYLAAETNVTITK